jgi:transposase-like protein
MACYKADLDRIYGSTAVDEQMLRLHGQQFRLYGAVDPSTNETLRVSRYPIATKQTTRWFLTELHQRYQLDDAEFLVDDADCLGRVLGEDGARFQALAVGSDSGMPRRRKGDRTRQGRTTATAVSGDRFFRSF